MKKIALWGLAALCLGFTACDDYETPNPPAQSNPAEAMLEASNLVFSQTEADKAQFNLDALAAEGKAAEVANINLTSALPAGYELSNVMEVSATDKYEKVAEVNTTTTLLEGSQYVVGVVPADLQEAINKVVSKSPEVQTVNVRFAAYAVNGDSKARFGNPEYYYGNYTLTVKPLTPSYYISPAYYLIGTASDNSVATAVKFTHSGVSVYDDPVFSLAVDITADQANDGWKWMIISDEAFKAGNTNTPGTVFGQEFDEDDLIEGTLFPSTADFTPGYGMVYEEGPHLITFNAETLEYSIALTIANLYTPGGSNGWSQAASQMLYTQDYTNYYGFAHLNGEFKFSTQPDWDGINFGSAGTDGMLSNDGGASNLNAGADGLYWCHVNIASLTYELTNITSCGIIGSLNSWAEQAPLTPSADFLTWTGTVTFDAGGEWKIRFNDNWDISLGGALNDLSSFNGGNLASPGAGAYKVTLDLSTLPYKVTLTK